MTAYQKIEDFYTNAPNFKLGINKLRSLLESTELTEEWKWNFPTYTLNGKNIVGVARFKNHFGIWFFQGSFLKDEHKLLKNNQEGKTRGMRSLYYTSEDELDAQIVTQYVLEAIENSLQGKVIKPKKRSITYTIPAELDAVFTADPVLKSMFMALTPGRQKDYANHIGTAKQPATRQRRLQKCIPLIAAGKGINDTYKR